MAMATLRSEAAGRTRREPTSPARVTTEPRPSGQAMPYNLDVVRSLSEVGGPSRVRALRDRGTDAAERIKSWAAGSHWSHLTAVDFLNSSFAFAALAVVSAFPFLAVVSAATESGASDKPSSHGGFEC